MKESTQRWLLIIALVFCMFWMFDATEPEPAPTPTPKVVATPRPTTKPTPTPYVWEMEETPRSSCFSEVGYDAENEILHVVFRTTGIEYVYYDFTENDWNTFYNADSLGKYFNANIKGYFDYKKIG